MPAEWEPHEATWLAWPHNPEDWPGKFQSIPWLYAEIVRLLAAHERVHLIVENASAKQRVTSMLARAGANLDQVSFHAWPTDRGWTRDSGPIFVRNAEGRVALTNWRFNAWAKYSDWRLDDKLPGHAAKLLGMSSWLPAVQNQNGAKQPIVLEGGSIDVNGSGSLLTTEECQLSDVQQRNPGVSREQLECVFHDYLGIDHTIWLNRGIVGDDTHADNLSRLKSARTPQGKQFTIVELPMPRPVVFRGQRLPASYANFYVANDLVLVPTFHDPNDRVALNTLAELFPGRDIIGVHCVDLIWGLGALHCMTQQQPAAVPSKA
jgi:agmatine deiminase